ncbi:hypothetical protein SYK_23900 [Pseudodesulfovibrio nedwellii]|uniref:Uncharacterized protein n=1 Tax=Pseudodesulfovibrio nedwellii TaxID=2973072 RepID=A0ABM8B2K5_9BACT|nr:hypothetical protein [Pseudodesulfovibrio nedwellii]BDQ38030.1 hypothetical protein SYK_23900 [Pseudodesulfovibrio nedwellii]
MPRTKEEQEKETRKYIHDSIHRRDDLKKLIKEMPSLNVYRTPPSDENYRRCGCASIGFRVNEDLRLYLVMISDKTLDGVPDKTLAKLSGLELWKQSHDSEEIMRFFGRYYEPDKYDDTRLIVDRGWLELSNDTGNDWSTFKSSEEKRIYREAMPAEEKQRLKEEGRKELAEVAELALGIIRHDQRKAIKEMLKSWLPWNWFRR